MNKDSLLKYIQQTLIIDSNDTIAYFGQIAPDELHIRLNVNKDGKVVGQFNEVIKLSEFQNWLSKNREDKLENLGI